MERLEVVLELIGLSPLDIEIRMELFQLQLPAVQEFARRFSQRMPSNVDVDDVVAEANVAFLLACRTFKPRCGVNFQAFWRTKVRFGIVDYLRQIDCLTRCDRAKLNRLTEAKRDFRSECGRELKSFEIAIQMGHDVDEALRLDEISSSASLNQIPVPLVERWSEPNHSMRAEKLDLLRLVSSKLAQQEKIILISYYYLELSMKEIAQSLELSEARVSKTHSRIITKLQDAFGTRCAEFQF